ncbi:GNAT family N-acetyltransferase [Poseidonocella sedimentorum]|uniref:Ribosomal-protein-alanine N-acetyltransferase n=1 Tax=Poseidonocella sedimentorum TaxID=871652 RepID=A0A1I6DSE4_9RHOB|nr:GNAT family N-acetyltransferase [Poseidonocella sedimentorum]SFR08281.1 ribosomal-protein-alanine N-acetyltransferase [Poseidonocella sedimentorum]
MTAPDPAELAALHAKARGPDRFWSAEEFRSLLAARHVFALTDPATAPHAFVLSRAVADEAELLLIATDAAHQRRGHAARLLAAFEAEAAARGARQLFLEVAADNRPALALYAAHGWQTTGTRPRYYARPSGPRVDAALMQKSVT